MAALLFNSPLFSSASPHQKPTKKIFMAPPSAKLWKKGIRSQKQPGSARAEDGMKLNDKRMEEYNVAMKRMMRNPYQYHHDLGMNYTQITDELIVGSQPQKAEDVDHLKEEMNVTCIINLQQDKDIDYWGVDLNSIINRCRELNICHLRRPAVDFDPDSLRKVLPSVVASIDRAVSKGEGRVYVHCTAGLGRAPASAISFLFWFRDMNLDTAYDMLISKRPCGPNKRAIRGATYDLCKNDPCKEPFEGLPDYAFSDVSDWERKLIQDRVRSLCHD